MDHAGDPLIVFNILDDALQFQADLLIPHRTLQKFWTNASLAKLGFGTALYRQLGCHSLSFAQSRFNYCRVSLNNSPSD
jgi:hypothetical protein